MNINNPL